MNWFPSINSSGFIPNYCKYFAYHFFLYSFFLLLISLYNASLYSLIENFLLSFMGILIGSGHTISSSGDQNSLTYLCLIA
jgi:hypothetical protein